MPPLVESGETGEPVERELEIAREKLVAYFEQRFLILALILILYAGLGLLLLLIYYLFFRWVPRAMVERLRYRLSGTTLCVDGGIYFRHQKRIPLDRMTDLVLVEGPLMRRCGVRALRVQTPGRGSQWPEATLYGLAEAEVVRDFLIRQRDAAARAGRE